MATKSPRRDAADPDLRRRRPCSPAGTRLRREPPVSAWSTRPRSSPRRASWRATRSTTAAAALAGDPSHDGARRGVRLTFEDRGPGIADIQLALRDGYTTGTGLGLGLSGAQAPVERILHRLDARRRHPRDHCALEMTCVPVPITEATQVAEARRPLPNGQRRAGSTRPMPAAWPSSRRSSPPTWSSTAAAASCSSVATRTRPGRASS